VELQTLPLKSKKTLGAPSLGLFGGQVQEGIKEASQEHEESSAGQDGAGGLLGSKNVRGVNAVDEFTGLRKPIRTLR